MTGSSCILCSFECRGTMDSDKYCTVRLQAGVRNCQPSPAPDGRRDRGRVGKRCNPLPPHQTVREVFPHTAFRHSSFYSITSYSSHSFKTQLISGTTHVSDLR